ncbi:MAG TPA: ZIP family metal transporter [Candidatus Woesebacteria bacterium]|nr:ZIP family metal transporter [Candidatus Woesebacteria bacterium]HOY60958.1 ZIP family metal transporter [Candidatus Woesebacteria bacterium]HPR99773.1 ZIP family metal transporter [Candidatus Woesebacteria bacterium]
MNPILLALLASGLISLVSLLGILFIKIKKNRLKGELLTLVGVATGALLGDAFLHLIPESMAIINSEKTGLMIITGMLIFFSLEKILKWRHCHDIDCDQNKELVWISLLADSIHNLIDGLIIGNSFMISIPIGISTSLAVFMHEIPQEIGDFAILIHGGFSAKKAALMNLGSAFLSVLGVLVIWLISDISKIQGELMAITAGGFIYLAASDLIPELHRHENKIKQSLWQMISVLIGLGIMYFLL